MKIWKANFPRQPLVRAKLLTHKDAASGNEMQRLITDYMLHCYYATCLNNTNSWNAGHQQSWTAVPDKAVCHQQQCYQNRAPEETRMPPPTFVNENRLKCLRINCRSPERTVSMKPGMGSTWGKDSPAKKADCLTAALLILDRKTSGWGHVLYEFVGPYGKSS